jgi:hypothetical protein
VSCFLPAELALAHGYKLLIGKSRSSKIERIVSPTGLDSNNSNNCGGILASIISAALTQVIEDRTPEASGMANYFAIHAEKTGLLDGPYKTKSRSSKIERIVSPTAPVAPTTQTLNFLFIKPKFENNKMNALYLLSK